ncbi:Fic family protein [Promicromonospora sp. NPDC057138]|uniref:Fic family protein n=1 Tax=Promicromonospora sp. NPDC057138 TaxID=3346031 RepID=UPI00363815B2
MPESIRLEPHRSVVAPWEQSVRGGTADDRRLSEVTVRLPPHIADLDLVANAHLTSRLEVALREIANLDHAHGAHLDALSALLLRNESVASSKIEHVEASIDDFARAMHGIRANESATSMVASTHALEHLIASVAGGADLTLTNIHRAHAALMADDPYEKDYAGRFRDMQNWIGGSDYSPRGALFVPPPPETVDAYMNDLVRFANRDDLSALVQAAVVHAQFESIHPYTDGNGRIGRALVNTVLRRRGVTSRVVVPLASALVVHREEYFDTLNSYRDGDAGPVVEAFTVAAVIAAEESRTTADRFSAMPEEWATAAGRPRRGSTAAELLTALPAHPVFSTEDAEDMTGGATSTVYAAISRLHDAGIIRPLTDRTRNQVWGTVALLDELGDLGLRIGTRARTARTRP